MTAKFSSPASVTIAYALGLADGAAPVGSSGLEFALEKDPESAAAFRQAGAQLLLEKLGRAAAGQAIELTQPELEAFTTALDLAGQRLRRDHHTLKRVVEHTFSDLMSRGLAGDPLVV